MIETTLSWFELYLAAMIGARRNLEALRKGYQPAAPDERQSIAQFWGYHIEGAAGEMAFSKAIDRYFSGIPVHTFKGGDVGSLQIRTRSRHDYELLVRDRDNDEDVFVLLTGLAPTYRLIGWIRGRDAKRPEWRRGHGGMAPAFFVPHSSLHPISDLAAAVDA